VRRRIQVRDEGYRACLNPQHGPALLNLARKPGTGLGLGTRWEENANPSIGARMARRGCRSPRRLTIPGAVDLYRAYGPLLIC
jgi:hypothetical protein